MPAQVFGVDEGGMMAAFCVNSPCPEFEIPKPFMCEVKEGETIYCGQCSNPCDSDWFQGLTYTIPAPPWEEPVAQLQEQMNTMTAMLLRIATTMGVDMEESE